MPLTPAQKKEFGNAFALFDRDRDNLINAKELGNVYRTLGGAPSEAQVKRLIAECDTDGDGALNKEEFLGFMELQLAGSLNEAEITTAFSIMSDDTNKTGQMPVAALRSMLTSVGEKLTAEEFDTLMKDAAGDIEGDLINYPQFVHNMMKNST